MFLKRAVVRNIAGAVALGLLIFLALRTPMPAGAARPLEGLAGFFRSLRAAGAKFSRLLGGSAALEFEERAELLAQAARSGELLVKVQALERALGISKELGFKVMPAAILGFLREGRDEFILIGRGRADGLAESAAVLDKRKVLVGSVASLAARVAKVKLLTSPSQTLEVLIEPLVQADGRESVKALARGRNIGEFEIDLVPQGARVERGDLVFAAPDLLRGRRERLLVGEVREIRKTENQVFIPISAVHLFDPFTSGTVFVVADSEPL